MMFHQILRMLKYCFFASRNSIAKKRKDCEKLISEEQIEFKREKIYCLCLKVLLNVVRCDCKMWEKL
jgi:hypothetical protein